MLGFVLSTTGFEPSGEARMLVVPPFSEANATYSLVAPDDAPAAETYVYFFLTSGPGVSLVDNVTVYLDGEYYASGSALLKSLTYAQGNGSISVNVSLQNAGNVASSASVLVSSNSSNVQEKDVYLKEGEEATLMFVFPAPSMVSVYTFNVTVLQGESSFSHSFPVIVRAETSPSEEKDLSKVFIICLIILGLLAVFIALFSLWKKSQRKGYGKRSESRTIRHSMDFLNENEAKPDKIFELRKRKR
jgi:hypothetical protein